MASSPGESWPGAVNAMALPSSSSSPSRTGIGTGALSAWPGVGATVWESSSSSTPASRSHAERIETSGVPAWRYQLKKAERSRPETSAKHWMNCSTVAAVPSQRSKYRSMPARNASAPRRVFSMRMISEPFS